MEKIMKGAIVSICILLLLSALYRKTRIYYYEPIFEPFSTKLNAHKLVLQVGETFRLRPQAINKRVTYKSSNFRVVDVFPIGKLYAKAVGEAVITVEGKKGKAYCKVTVIDISRKKAELMVGEQIKLYITGTQNSVKWYSSNDKVSVTKDGLVTAKEAGTATVTGNVDGKELTCNIYIKNIP